MAFDFSTGLVAGTKSAAQYANSTIDGITTNVASQVGALVPNLENAGKQAIAKLGASLPGNIGGVSGFASSTTAQVETTGGASAKNSAGGAPDFRVKLRAQTKAVQQVYGANTSDNILKPLHDMNGMLFPYTPTIDWMQAVEYKTMSLTHSNQDYLSYSNTPSTQLRVSGDFTVQNDLEGRYMLAVMHFLRVVSKMYFGKPNTNANGNAIGGYPSGMPPPVLLFSGYGNYMFNDLPVIVKDHAYSLGKDVDYIDIDFGNGNMARLPAILSISMTLQVQNTPNKLREEFNLDKFRTGELMRGGKKGWI